MNIQLVIQLLEAYKIDLEYIADIEETSLGQNYDKCSEVIEELQQIDLRR